jgi:hypothetical protein
MEWFMVWLTLTNASVAKPVARSFGWLGVCLPIKTAALHGLDRKFVEQNA